MCHEGDSAEIVQQRKWVLWTVDTGTVNHCRVHGRLGVSLPCVCFFGVTDSSGSRCFHPLQTSDKCPLPLNILV